MENNENISKNKNTSFEKMISDLDEYFFKINNQQLYKFIIEEVEKPLIEKALERTFGNQLKAAKLLGINRNTLRAKIKKLGIQVDRWKF